MISLGAYTTATWTKMRTKTFATSVFTLSALHPQSDLVIVFLLKFPNAGILFLSHHHPNWFVQIAVARDTLGTKRLAVVGSDVVV